MRAFDLIKGSLKYYWKLHLAVILGVALSGTILIGALIIGDSVKGTLLDTLNFRLGKIEQIIYSENQIFSSTLAERIGCKADCQSAAILYTHGIVSAHGGKQRASGVQILGIDQAFWQFSPSQKRMPELASNQIIINKKISKRLNLSVGDSVVVRFKAGLSRPQDLPIGGVEKNQSYRLKIVGIISDQDFGRFSLSADQKRSDTIFINHNSLTSKLSVAGKSNLIILDTKISSQKLDNIINSSISIEDTGLVLSQTNQLLKINSEKVFIDAKIAKIEALSAGKGILTYLVNQIKAGNKSTPYSFVSGLDKDLMPAEIKDNEIIVNDWLAQDLALQTGSIVQLKYYVMTSQARLQEETADFTVRAIIKPQGISADPTLMPDLSGITEVENCKDWDTDFSIDLDKIRAKDEEYWNQNKGCPKAFINLIAAQNLWSNHYGNLTEIRFSNQPDRKFITEQILAKFPARVFGIYSKPIRSIGQKAGSTGVDFGQLFIGLSFFLYVASVLLLEMIYIFSIENRASQLGILMAMGFSNKWIKRNRLAEGLLLTIPGLALAVIFAIAYAKIMLFGLETIWSGAVAATDFNLHILGSTILVGIGITLLVMYITMLLCIKYMQLRPVRELIETVKNNQQRGYITNLLIMIIAYIGSIIIVIKVEPSQASNAMALFFGGGALIIIGSLALCNLVIIYIAKRLKINRGLHMISLRGLTIKPARTITMIGLVSCGVFLTIGVGVNRKDMRKDVLEMKSGSGGFALYCQTTMPVLDKLDSQFSQKKYALKDHSISDLEIAYFQTKAGDDASCLNLNRVSNPPLLGIDSQSLSGRFEFAALLPEFVKTENPWDILAEKQADGMIAGIGDLTMIKWGLGKKIGDVLEYQDEYGENFKIKLVAGLASSILQGKILISQENFNNKYPNVSGYNILLIDGPADKLQAGQAILEAALKDIGFESQSAVERLALYANIENTYLIIFMMLGGLGLILGTVGLGIMVIRTTLERQQELAIMQAIGYNIKTLKRILNLEYWLILLFGTIIGLSAALMAAIPAIMSPISDIPWLLIVVIVIAIAVIGRIWIKVATKLTLPNDLAIKYFKDSDATS